MKCDRRWWNDGRLEREGVLQRLHERGLRRERKRGGVMFVPGDAIRVDLSPAEHNGKPHCRVTEGCKDDGAHAVLVDVPFLSCVAWRAACTRCFVACVHWASKPLESMDQLRRLNDELSPVEEV